MSHVQTAKEKPCKKVMNSLTNNIEKFPKRLFPNPKISLQFWLNSKNIGSGGTGGNLPN
jgi:hypothetical protein